MKTKIIIRDSNGLRKAEDFLNRIKHTPYYAKIPARVKAWLKVQNAMEHYSDVLIAYQEDEPRHLFNFQLDEEDLPEYQRREVSYNQRLTDGFAMMSQDD